MIARSLRRPGATPLALASLVPVLGSIAAILAILAGAEASLIVIAGLILAFAAVFTPGIVFAAYLLIPFYKGAVQGYSPVDITVLLALLNVLQIVPVLLDRRPRAVSTAGILLWVALAVLILGGILYAPDPGLASGRVANWGALVFLPILAAALRVGSDPRHVRQFLWAFFGAGIVTVVLGITQLSSNERLVVLGMNTIQVARAALLVPVLAGAFVLVEGRLAWRAAAIALIPAALVVALASGSRGPVLVFVALALLAAISYVSRPHSRDWRPVVIGLGLASIVTVSIVAADVSSPSIARFELLGDSIQAGLAGDLEASPGDTSTAARMTLFGFALSLFEEHPILGVGPAGFEALSPRLLGPTEADAYPHDALLQFAAESGLVGVALFLGLVVLGLTRRLPPGSVSGAVRVAFLFFLLNAMVSGNIFDDRETWGLLMLILLIDTPRVVRQRTGSRDAPIGLRSPDGTVSPAWARPTPSATAPPTTG